MTYDLIIIQHKNQKAKQPYLKIEQW